MGMAFPLGLRLAAGHAAALTPWLWGVNGATSVLAAVLAVAIAFDLVDLDCLLDRCGGLWSGAARL